MTTFIHNWLIQFFGTTSYFEMAVIAVLVFFTFKILWSIGKALFVEIFDFMDEVSYMKEYNKWRAKCREKEQEYQARKNMTQE